MRSYSLIKTASSEYGYEDNQSHLSNTEKAAIAAGVITAGGAGFKYGGPKLAEYMKGKINDLANDSDKIKKLMKKQKDGENVFKDETAAKNSLKEKWDKMKGVAEHKYGNYGLGAGAVTTAGLGGYGYYDRHHS